MRSLPFADASFDVVWSQMVLYYVPNPEAAVQEFRRLLRPGGTLIVSIIDNLLGTNLPEDPALQPRLQQVVPRLGDILIARKLPLMLRETGFEDICLEIEMDPVFTAIGSIAPDHRQNFEVGLTAGMSRIIEVLGSRAEAETFLNDVLAYLDRSDTCTYSTLWIVKGVAGSA